MALHIVLVLVVVLVLDLVRTRLKTGVILEQGRGGTRPYRHWRTCPGILDAVVQTRTRESAGLQFRLKAILSG